MSLSPSELFIHFNISIKSVGFVLLWITHSHAQETKSACKIFNLLILTYGRHIFLIDQGLRLQFKKKIK